MIERGLEHIQRIPAVFWILSLVVISLLLTLLLWRRSDNSFVRKSYSDSASADDRWCEDEWDHLARELSSMSSGALDQPIRSRSSVSERVVHSINRALQHWQRLATANERLMQACRTCAVVLGETLADADRVMARVREAAVPHQRALQRLMHKLSRQTVAAQELHKQVQDSTGRAASERQHLDKTAKSLIRGRGLLRDARQRVHRVGEQLQRLETLASAGVETAQDIDLQALNTWLKSSPDDGQGHESGLSESLAALVGRIERYNRQSRFDARELSALLTTLGGDVESVERCLSALDGELEAAGPHQQRRLVVVKNHQEQDEALLLNSTVLASELTTRCREADVLLSSLAGLDKLYNAVPDQFEESGRLLERLQHYADELEASLAALRRDAAARASPASSRPAAVDRA